MARKTVPRTLLRLPGASALARSNHKADKLQEILRRVALTNQKEQPQAFYSLREVAQHFQLPLSSVSRIYRRLEQEGILSRVRGSKTVLQGLNYDRRLSVRAFVGIPASLSQFVTLQDYRMFFIQARRELRLRGFATAMVFFEPNEVATAAYAERLRSHEVDTVIWFRPLQTAKQTLLRLADWGIRVVGITEEANPPVPCRYRIRRGVAISRLLEDWKSQVGEPITIVRSESRQDSSSDEKLLAVLKELQIRYDSVLYTPQNAEAFVRRLAARETAGIIFGSSRLSSLLSFRAPDALSELVRTRRVAFADGAVNMPFAELPDLPVDLITVDWHSFAEGLVADLITQDAFDNAKQTTFEADLHLRVPLRRFAQEI